MSPITDLKWTGNVLSWAVNGEVRQVVLNSDVTNAILLHSCGIGVIEGNDWDAKASILNADGSLRASLRNPFGREDGMMFYYFNYEGGNLVVILAGTTRDFACQVDEADGTLAAPRETR